MGHHGQQQLFPPKESGTTAPLLFSGTAVAGPQRIADPIDELAGLTGTASSTRVSSKTGGNGDESAGRGGRCHSSWTNHLQERELTVCDACGGQDRQRARTPPPGRCDQSGLRGVKEVLQVALADLDLAGR